MSFAKYFIICVVILVSISSASAGIKLHGFGETAYGTRLNSGDTTRHTVYNYAEQRFQLKMRYYPSFSEKLEDMGAEIFIKGDAVFDTYDRSRTILELREANASFSPLGWLDIKLGRQIFTWGTGDYIFINDLFPKDYESFFIGREDEYLKKPSDGIKASVFNSLVNADLIAIPFFEPNTVADGRRLSFYDMFLGRTAGSESVRNLEEPIQNPSNMESAVRLFRNIKSYETALYAFRGYYKNPMGVSDTAANTQIYPRLNAYGASLRGSALKGIFNLETGYYDSVDDDSGRNRLVVNSYIKTLAGFAMELGNDTSIGLQYLHEVMLRYSEYKAAFMQGEAAQDEIRRFYTLRLTKLFMKQTLMFSVFSFFSPTDEDYYIKPVAAYDITDRWKASIGANIVRGEKVYTEFGQMRKNSNIFARMRYSF